MGQFNSNDLWMVEVAETNCDVLKELLEHNGHGNKDEKLEVANRAAMVLINTCEEILYQITSDKKELGKFARTRKHGGKRIYVTWEALELCAVIKGGLQFFEKEYEMCCECEEMIRSLKNWAIALMLNLDDLIA